MALTTVFVTGSTGCVGHYVIESLLRDPNVRILALARKPETIFSKFLNHPQVELIQGNLLDMAPWRARLEEADVMVHIATSWHPSGKADQVNTEKTIEMLDDLVKSKCQKVIYFSTASIIDENNQALDIAGQSGMPYIRSKFKTHQILENHPIKDKLIVVYPTLVFGGDDQFPVAHATKGFLDRWRLFKWLRWFKADGGFHFIHSADIAQMVDYWVHHDLPTGDRHYVLGQPFLTIEDAFKIISKELGIRLPSLRIQLKPEWILALEKLKLKKFTRWDRYCIQKRFFRHKTTRPEDVGLASKFGDLGTLISDLKGRAK